MIYPEWFWLWFSAANAIIFACYTIIPLSIRRGYIRIEGDANAAAFRWFILACGVDHLLHTVMMWLGVPLLIVLPTTYTAFASALAVYVLFFRK